MTHAEHIQADEFHTVCERCRDELYRIVNGGGRDGASNVVFQIVKVKP